MCVRERVWAWVWVYAVNFGFLRKFVGWHNAKTRLLLYTLQTNGFEFLSYFSFRLSIRMNETSFNRVLFSFRPYFPLFCLSIISNILLTLSPRSFRFRPFSLPFYPTILSIGAHVYGAVELFRDEMQLYFTLSATSGMWNSCDIWLGRMRLGKIVHGAQKFCGNICVKEKRSTLICIFVPWAVHRFVKMT